MPLTLRAQGLALMQVTVDESLQAGHTTGVLLVRLLRFRELNVQVGYELGAQVAISSADLLRTILREIDVVLMLAEDEIVAVLPHLHGPNHALLAAHRVERAFRTPLSVAGNRVLVAVSIGVAVGPTHGTTADSLCRRADIAFGDATRNGEHIAMFSPREGQAEIPHVELKDAIEHGVLEAHLQPIMELAGRRIVGAESLARWQHPLRGAISPSVFIALAEQTGLIGELTRWSINASLRVAGSLALAARGMHVSINLSPKVFLDQTFGDQLLAALKLWDMPPAAVVLEITETALMEDLSRSASVLTRMRDAGMSIAIDDFGTGYSSFAYLHRFPATEMKIDQTFVRDLRHDKRTAQLVRSMIDLAHHLHMRVVAEGVEDEETLNLLQDMGCDLAQGYLIGRAVRASELATRLDATTAGVFELRP